MRVTVSLVASPEQSHGRSSGTANLAIGVAGPCAVDPYERHEANFLLVAAPVLV
jgi:hypothetical protein